MEQAQWLKILRKFNHGKPQTQHHPKKEVANQIRYAILFHYPRTERRETGTVTDVQIVFRQMETDQTNSGS